MHTLVDEILDRIDRARAILILIVVFLFRIQLVWGSFILIDGHDDSDGRATIKRAAGREQQLKENESEAIRPRSELLKGEGCRALDFTSFAYFVAPPFWRFELLRCFTCEAISSATRSPSKSRRFEEKCRE